MAAPQRTITVNDSSSEITIVLNCDEATMRTARNLIDEWELPTATPYMYPYRW